MSGRTVVIAGGGPVGAVTAIMLAAQGWKVQVFEAASLPSLRPSQQDHRAYRLNLTTRGLNVLKLAKVDVDSIIATQGKLLEAAIYKADGSKLRSFSTRITEDPICVRAFRDDIALCIIMAAQRLFPQAIDFHFNTPIQKVDLNKQSIYVSTAGSNTAEVQYDLLVGADGAGSTVRSALEQVMPAGYMRRYKHKQVYAMAQATPSNPAEIPQHTATYIHTVKVAAHKYSKLSIDMSIRLMQGGMVLWDGQGSNDCRVGLTLPREQADAIRQGNTDEAVQMLTQGAPSLPNYARKAALALVHARPHFYPVPSWTHLSQLHGPKTVLLGDAAHTMTPVWGQGLNSGLEDVAVFAQCLEQHQGNVNAALPAYNKARLPDIQAIMTLNEVAASNDVGLASQDQDTMHKMWLLGHKLLLVVHMVGRTVLHKAAPSIFDGPCLIGVAMGASPYRSLISALYKDGALLAGLLASVATIVVRML